jgi:diacylglycerol kinase (ATP)
MKPGRTGLSRILYAAVYSWQGIVAACKHESAFRQELILAVLMIPAAFWLGRGIHEYILLVGSVLLVLIVELLNSGIEAIVDRVGHELHELSGRAKDMGSAAVLISLLLVALVWGLVIYDRFVKTII